MIRAFQLFTVLFLLLALGCCSKKEKIHGVNLEMPPQPISQQQIDEMKDIHIEWVAAIPYAFIRPEHPEVRFQYAGRWWGESVEGTAACIRMAHAAGMKVMLKPHVWVAGQGWAGEFEPSTPSAWQAWEESYRTYILTYAHMADSMNVALFCIGTEYRKVSAKRPDYWRQLIADVRKIYDGPITYAANWDEYQHVTFWNDLDYIGVDAYFPLSKNARPSLDELTSNWQVELAQLEELSNRHDKPILFTEYGYKSIEYTNSGHWNYREDTVAPSMEAQATAYEALYRASWHKEWLAGGFFWKWHFPKMLHRGDRSTDYTPQGKMAEEVIRTYYGTKN